MSLIDENLAEQVPFHDNLLSRLMSGKLRVPSGKLPEEGLV
jgi:hypothetical protein